jgi:hypothetical protein
VAFTSTAYAWNDEYQDFPYITTDGLKSAMTLSTLPESPSAFLFNPAAMPGSILPRVAHNHSARHFPSEGGESEMDQLDNDYESVVLPLPLGSIGWGFTLADEHGYDYTNHPVGRFPYKREQVNGGESCLAYSVGSYPVSLGASLRKFHRKHYSGNEPIMGLPLKAVPRFADSLVEGEDQCLGMLAGLPWMRLAYVNSRLDARKTQLPVGKELVYQQKEKRCGWRFNPVAWISVAEERAKTVKQPFTIEGAQMEAETEVSHGRSIAVRPFPLLEVSLGEVDGKRAWGCKLALPALTLKYAEIKDFLGRIVGSTGRFFTDLHYYGFDLTLW